jgi:hypothetical protein
MDAYNIIIPLNFLFFFIPNIEVTWMKVTWMKVTWMKVTGMKF